MKKTFALFVIILLYTPGIVFAQECTPEKMTKAAQKIQEHITLMSQKDPDKYQQFVTEYNAKLQNLQQSPDKLCEYYVQLAESLDD